MACSTSEYIHYCSHFSSQFGKNVNLPTSYAKFPSIKGGYLSLAYAFSLSKFKDFPSNKSNKNTCKDFFKK